MPAGPRTCPPRLGVVLTGSLEDTPGGVEPVARGVERLLGVFAGGLGFGQSVLCRSQRVPKPGEREDRLPRLPRPVCHPTIITSG